MNAATISTRAARFLTGLATGTLIALALGWHP